MQVYEPLPALRQGKKLMDYIHEAQYAKFDTNGSKRSLLDLNNPERIRADDIVSVVYKNQKPISGQVLMVKRKGIASNMLLRQKMGGLGVEIMVPLFHPQIARVDIIKRPQNYRPRNRHYYIRNSRLDVKEIVKK
ncbi:mitochondrial 54S ribosomal protein [Martiniozyma asiatica (nom. inval.)]|nr:mitochondrial 54S ribosomal protein [Martiniozyma asiatica]